MSTAPEVPLDGTRNERGGRAKALRPRAAIDVAVENYLPTEVVTPEGALKALEPDEQRLVALACALAAQRAWELLELYDPARSRKLVEAARTLVSLDRRERLGIVARHLSPPLTQKLSAEAVTALRREPAWFAAMACRALPAPLRDRLLYQPEIQSVWEARPSPHPALESYARRFASCLLGG